MNEQSYSPTPAPMPDTERGQMSFPDAMTEVIRGKRVTRLEWDDKNTYIYLQGRLRIHFSDGKDTDLLVSDGDMVGLDWVVV
jgi:hypothetical protein